MDGIIKAKRVAKPLKVRTEPKTEQKEEVVSKKEVANEIKWETLEYEYTPKSNNWFWTVGIITVGLAAASVLLDNVLFAIFVVLAGFTISLYAARKPKKILFSLSNRGIRIGDRIYLYENLASFWLRYNPPYQKILLIEPKKFFMPAASVPLGDTDPNEAREYLLKFLKEKYQEESLIETISHLIGL